MRRILAIVVWLACSIPALGENPDRPATNGDLVERVSALRRAATHLDVAGLPDEAARVRGMADELVERYRAAHGELLERKLAELEALQAEIETLRQRPRLKRQIRTDIRVFQVNRTKLREFGFDWAAIDHGRNGALEAFRGFQSHDVVSGILVTLRHYDIAKQLADPTIISLSGREAVFRSGGETLPQGDDRERGVAPVWTGTEVVLTATQVDDSRIRIEGSLRIAVPSSNREHGREARLREARLPHFAFEKREGGTSMFELFEAGARFVDDGSLPDNDDTATLVLVRTEFVNADVLTTQSSGGAAPRAAPPLAPSAVPTTMSIPRMYVEVPRPHRDSSAAPTPSIAPLGSRSTARQVLFECQLLSVPSDHLRGLGLGLNAEEFMPACVLDSRAEVKPMLDALLDRGVAKELAWPKLATVMGRSACFNLGERDLNMPAFELTANEQGEDGLLLNWRTRAYHPPRPGQPPSVRPLAEVHSRAEMKYGQTMLVRVWCPKEANRNQPDDVHGDDGQAHILLVTPHKVEDLNPVADRSAGHGLSPVRQIRTDIQIVQIDRTRLRAVGMDWEHARIRGQNGAVEFRGQPQLDVSGNWLKALRRHGYAKVLAEPTVISVSGRKVRFRSGGNVAAEGRNTAAENPPTWNGADLAFTATQTEKRRFLIKGSMRVSVPLPDQGEGRGPATRVVRLPHFAFETTEYGTIMFDPIAAGGRFEDDNSAPGDSGTEMLVLLRTQFVGEATTAQPVDCPAPVENARPMPDESFAPRQLVRQDGRWQEVTAPPPARHVVPLSNLTPPQQVLFVCRLIEIDGDRLRDTGLDWENTVAARVLPTRDDLQPMLDILLSRGIAKELAKPKLVTVVGRPATFRIGQADQETQEFELKAHEFDDGSLCMNWQTRDVLAPNIDQPTPDRRRIEVESAVVMKYGQTMLVRVLRAGQRKKEGSDQPHRAFGPIHILMVTATKVDGPGDVADQRSGFPVLGSPPERDANTPPAPSEPPARSFPR